MKNRALSSLLYAHVFFMISFSNAGDAGRIMDKVNLLITKNKTAELMEKAKKDEKYAKAIMAERDNLLVLAVKFNNIQAVNLLLEAKADPLVKDEFGRPLTTAACLVESCGSGPISMALSRHMFPRPSL